VRGNAHWRTRARYIGEIIERVGASVDPNYTIETIRVSPASAGPNGVR
jgi:hypothetical protein